MSPRWSHKRQLSVICFTYISLFKLKSQINIHYHEKNVLSQSLIAFAKCSLVKFYPSFIRLYLNMVVDTIVAVFVNKIFLVFLWKNEIILWELYLDMQVYNQSLWYCYFARSRLLPRSDTLYVIYYFSDILFWNHGTCFQLENCKRYIGCKKKVNKLSGWPASGKIRENQGISKARFQIRESQGKWTFSEKIREKSGNFIMNQGKKSGKSRYLCAIY